MAPPGRRIVVDVSKPTLREAQDRQRRYGGELKEHLLDVVDPQIEFDLPEDACG